MTWRAPIGQPNITGRGACFSVWYIVGDRGDSARSHWTAEYYRQSGLFQRLVYSRGQKAHSGVGVQYRCGVRVK